MLKRNYDLVATVGTAGLFVALHAPWWLWVALGGLVAYQLTHRPVAR